MSKLYLHKLDVGKVKTIRNTIIADVSKIKNSLHPRNYIYVENKLHKIPKEFILTGGSNFPHNYSNLSFVYFPVERVIIDSDFHAHRILLKLFRNVKELEIGNNVKFIEITNNLGLNNIDNLIIPFGIEDFTDEFIISDNLKKITIKDNDNKCVLDIDEIFNDRNKEITITNKSNMLIVNINSNYTNLKYEVCVNKDKLDYTKKYITYELKPDEDKTLDVFKLNEQYNCLLMPNKILDKEKVIIPKEYYNILKFVNINLLKELIIKDDNEMSLFPRTINISSNNGIFQNIEVLNDKLLIHIEKEDKTDIYILINEDLSYVDLDINRFNMIDKIYLNFDNDKFSMKKNNGKYILNIPINKSINLKHYAIFKSLIHRSSKIYIKNKNGEYEIDKFVPKEAYLIGNIKRYSDNDFIVYYNHLRYEEVYQHIIYIYDKYREDYCKTIGREVEQLHEQEYINAKKLIRK